MKKAWRKARQHLAGGVDSPVRAFKAVEGTPVFMRQGRGPYLYDVNGERSIDFCLSWGAILFGHADGQTVKAIQHQASLGTSFGTATEYETTLAQEIKKAFPGMERIRFTSSGTEAVMSAIRLARGVTHKNRIVKFEGGYHGHADSLLVKAGSGLATFGSPSSRGIPPSLAELTTVLEYNNTEEARRFLRKRSDIACVILEPIAGNMGVIPARQDFLQAIREETARQGSLLIFDEVISGFRVTYGGAQHLYGFEPDLTILGKIIGGGLPVGAFGGKRQWMDALSPNGKVYQAGTLSGNSLAMAAGLSVLKRLSTDFYKALNQKSAAFFQEARSVLRKQGEEVVISAAGSMFTIFFSKKAPSNFKEIPVSHHKKFKTFFHKMLECHVYLPPSGFEACFLSKAHGEKELKTTLKALGRMRSPLKR